jgi:hypothetical protein
MHRGTIVLVDIKQSRVVIAADSRVATIGEKPDDHRCKITALGEKMIFAAAGIAGSNHTVLKSLNWDASKDAVEAFKTIHNTVPPKINDPVEAVAAEWEKKMKVRYTREERTALIDLLGSTTNDVLLDSVFVGLDAHGQITARELSFTFNRARAQKGGFAPVISSNQLWTIPAAMTLKAMGHSEIALEFASQASPRANIEFRRWQLEMLNRRNEDPDVLYLEHLIHLEITYATPNAGVGGDIDIASLDSGGTIQWIRRKRECPEDSLTLARSGPQKSQ